jgi:hypothetical protein
MKRHLQSTSYANVTATLALVIALGGTSYAAFKLPSNSVGNVQLKPSSVTSAKVKDKSLMAKDFKAGQLPAGKNGANGVNGANGAPGAPGAPGQPGPPGPAQYPQIVYKVSDPIENLNNSQVTGSVSCDPGMVAIGGGSFGFGGVGHAVNGSKPIDDHSGWEAWMNNETGQTQTFRVYAICSRALQVSPRPASAARR